MPNNKIPQEIKDEAKSILESFMIFANKVGIKEFNAPYWLCALAFPQEGE